MAIENKYAQIRRNGNVVCLVGDETLGMPVPDSGAVYTVDIQGHAQRDEVAQNMVYDPNTDTFAFSPIESEPTPDLFAKQQVIAAAELQDGAIVLNTPTGVGSGTTVKFEAPCDCSEVTAGIVINGITYDLVSAADEQVAGIGGAWVAGAQIAVLLDCEDRKAYVVNAAADIAVQKMPTAIDMTRSGQTVTITSTMEDGGEDVVSLELDEAGMPVQATIAGQAIPVNCEGFDGSAGGTFGEEYLTGEYYNGKPVYGVRTKFNALSEIVGSSVVKDYEIKATEIVDISAVVTVGSENFPYPAIMDGAIGVKAKAWVDEEMLEVSIAPQIAYFAEASAVMTVKYTK